MVLEKVVVTSFHLMAVTVMECKPPLWDYIKSRYVEQVSQNESNEAWHVGLKVLCMADEAEGVDKHPCRQQSACEHNYKHKSQEQNNSEDARHGANYFCCFCINLPYEWNFESSSVPHFFTVSL